VIDNPHLTELLDYSLKSGGKMLRPMLTLLSGRLFEYRPEKHLPMGSAVEIMHTATLVHDDAIDDSLVRRGRPTVNSIWGIDQAVLLGDYLFAEAGVLTASTGNLRVIKLFPETLKTISSGEINQAFNAFNLNQDRQQYYKRVAMKTAALFSMATESGAVLGGAPEEAIQALNDYSYNFGVAFQIVDDILDFISTEEELGKPTGSDLNQGTLTLPSLLILEKYPADNPVKRLFNNPEKKEETAQAIDMVRNSSIVPECYQVVIEFCDKARESL
jgi:geranylgeranyl pyrophosphate synthase